MADFSEHHQHEALPSRAPAHPKFGLPHLPQSAKPDLAHRRTENFSHCAMITISIRATYTEQTTLDAFFSQLFGYGKASVLVGSMPTTKHCKKNYTDLENARLVEAGAFPVHSS